jgi:diguanylate cyclase (GGDEF)-like protein
MEIGADAPKERGIPMPNTRDPQPAVSDDEATLARYLLVLFAIGPTFGLLGLVLPHAADANEAGILAVLAGSYLAAAVLFVFRTRLPEWGFDIAGAYAIALISASIYFSGETHTPGAVYYLWVVLAAAYFFDRKRVAVQLGLVAVCYAIALALKGWEPGMLQSWIVSVGTLSVAAALFVHTRERVASLVASLNQAAETDPLTELLNRRGFAKRLELDLERARRYESEISLISGDLDNFKQVNDSFGHQAGDGVLVDVANLLRRYARRSDAIARTGGEEFAVLVIGTPADALVAAERLRERIRDAFAERYPGLTISFGIASYPDDGTSAERLMRCADEALYAAKAMGRDRAVAHNRDTTRSLVARPS